MIVISGILEVAGHSADAFADLCRPLVEETRREPGCADYRFARSIDNSAVFEIFEEFADQEAMDHHVRADHYRSWSRALRDFEVISMSINRYDVTERTVLQ
ncbi:hypothetical protein GCM10022234_09190 [Aeromicrobium panaciterrae]|uniref:putative quinol monooxygenase n=1 Tax=Aeromicrobium panaciterrae TaxID=363861 RepID=UPI0031E335E0